MATLRTAEADMVDMGTLIGSVRCFGVAGPPYEILAIAPVSPTGEAQLRIRLLESGEEADHPVTAILDDPVAD